MFRLYVTIILLSMTLFASAQTKLGVSGGGTAAGFDYQEAVSNPSYQDENKFGGNVGLKLDISILGSKIFKLAPEFFFNQNGTKDEYYNSWTMFSDSLLANKISLDYFGIYFPLRISIPVNKEGSEFYFIVSGYADYTVSATVSSNYSENEEVIFKSGKNRLDYGYRVSIGGMPAEGFGFELGYNKGIQNVEFSTKLNSNATNYLINNKGFTLSVVKLF